MGGNASIGVTGFKLFQQGLQGSLLGGSAGVAMLTPSVESALVADAEAVPVVMQAVGPNHALGTTGLNGAVPPDAVVIADALPATTAVPLVNLLSTRGLVGPDGRAVDDDQRYQSHHG